MKNRLHTVFFVPAFCLVFALPIRAQAEIPKLKLPVLITSCGQSPGPAMLKMVFMRAKLQHDPVAYEVNELASPQVLIDKKNEGQPYGTLIIVMGASLKGMGAAGISIDDELDRATKLIQEARSQGIAVIGAHIEGMKRRAQGAAAGDTTDEQSIDTVAPNSDLLLIHKEGNEDDRFSIISKSKNIPMIEVEKNLDLIDEIKKLFSK